MRNAVALATVFVLAGCSDPGPESNEPAQFTVRGRWPDGVAISYRIETANSPIPTDLLVQAIERAAGAWNATGIVTFHPAAVDEKTADVTLSWRRGHHGACQPFGTGADVAHSGPVKPGTFIHFDLGRTWSDASVFGTALHELGHVLGLGHSEAPDAVMSTNPDRPTELSWHDLAGLHSLYGGGTSGPGDLKISGSATKSALVLRRVAPHPACEFSVFDSDGDGDAELLVWRTDAAGHGALMIYHFNRGPALTQTFGPLHGAVAPDSDVSLVTSDSGDRYLVSTFDNGNTVVRQFDRFGIPGQPRTPTTPELLERAGRSLRGDLDGDGTSDLVLKSR